LPHWLLLLRKGRQEGRRIQTKRDRKPLPPLQQIRPGAVDAWEHMASHREKGDGRSVLREDRPQLSAVAAGSQCQEPTEGARGAGAATRSASGGLDDGGTECPAAA